MASASSRTLDSRPTNPPHTKPPVTRRNPVRDVRTSWSRSCSGSAQKGSVWSTTHCRSPAPVCACPRSWGGQEVQTTILPLLAAGDPRQALRMPCPWLPVTIRGRTPCRSQEAGYQVIPSTPLRVFDRTSVVRQAHHRWAGHQNTSRSRPPASTMAAASRPSQMLLFSASSVSSVVKTPCRWPRGAGHPRNAVLCVLCACLGEAPRRQASAVRDSGYNPQPAPPPRFSRYRW